MSKHMCKVFALEKLWERTESGEFELYIWKNTPINPPFIDYKGQRCVTNHDMLILNRNIRRVTTDMKLHAFIGSSQIPVR